jgi:hypothetical protein
MTRAIGWKKAIGTALAIGVFLVPAFVGFGNKLLELVYLAGDEEGAFTVMPILNYLLASIGFFLLLCWAIAHGMFRDIEQPKHELLETERQLDEEEAATKFWSHDA